jgi:hypothetical protein
VEAALYLRERIQAELYGASVQSDDPLVRVAESFHTAAATLSNLERYETAPFRAFTRMLHELQRLQAMRAGKPVAAPAVLDVDVNISHENAGASPIVTETECQGG